MEEIVGMDMFQALHDLEEDALHSSIVQALVISRLHQLIQITFHVLHADVQLLAERVQEDVESRDQMSVGRERPQEDNLSQLQTWLK